MEELSMSAVLRFLQERGGRVRNQELLERFKGCLHPPGEGPLVEEEKARARQRFKDIVNELGSVRQGEDGAKYVCLRKRYRQTETAEDASPPPEEPEQEEALQPATEQEKPPPPPPLPEPPRIAVTCVPGDARSEEEEEDEPEAGTRGSRCSWPDAEPLPADSPRSLRGSCSSSPGMGSRSSRENFRELLLSGASPQLRRGCIFPPAGGAPRRAGSGSSEADSASLASEDAPLALDPLEHAWMLSASSGSAPWERLRALLAAEPTLLGRRDFITGCSCVHWAARHGRPELLAALLAFARQSGLPVDINARASGGYTALHLAAMHGHAEVAKMLIGAYDADVDIRDYSGRKAHHYLRPGTCEALRALVRGDAAEEEEAAPAAQEGPEVGRWSLSRVLPTGLIVHKLSQVLEEDQADSPQGVHRTKPVVRRPSGGNRPKARLNKIRFRTQIIHSTQPGFRGHEGENDGGPLKSPPKLRPKSNMFG